MSADTGPDLHPAVFQGIADEIAERAYQRAKSRRFFYGAPLRTVLSKIVDGYKKTGTIQPELIQEAEGWINEV